jgi:hypothetical protein
VLVLVATMVKEAIEDWRRKQQVCHTILPLSPQFPFLDLNLLLQSTQAAVTSFLLELKPFKILHSIQLGNMTN